MFENRSSSHAIQVWSSLTLAPLSSLRLPQELREIACVCFSSTGQVLASISSDPRHTMTLWDWEQGTRLASASTHTEGPVLCCAFAPAGLSGLDDSTLVTAGRRHVRLWRVSRPAEGKRTEVDQFRPPNRHRIAQILIATWFLSSCSILAWLPL